MSLHGLEKAILGLAIVFLLGIFVSMGDGGDCNAPVAGSGGIPNVNVPVADGGRAVVSGRKKRSEFLSLNAVFLFLAVFNVTITWRIYGQGGKYSMFAGKDVSLALVKHSSKDEDFNVDPTRLDALRRFSVKQLELSFESKFVKVGTIKKPGGAPDAC